MRGLDVHPYWSGLGKRWIAWTESRPLYYAAMIFFDN